LPLKTTKTFPVMAAVAAVVLALITAFVVATLFQSRAHYEDEADDTSRNLALALKNSLLAHFQEVDLSLQRADAEFGALHAQQKFSVSGFSAFLDSLKERMPQARAIRGSDANGMVIYGAGADPVRPQDLKIREFFARAKAEPGMVFGVPVVSRISGEMVFPLAHALHLPDGSFGGTVYVNTNNSRISELIASLELGPHGVITLFDADRRLLHRQPAMPGVMPGMQVQMSPAALTLLAGHSAGAGFRSVSRVDGQARRNRMERIGSYPVYILVGLAERDFLAPWHTEVRNSVGFLALLYLTVGGLLAGARVFLRRQREAVVALLAKEEVLQASLAARQASELRFRSFAEGLPQMVWTTRDGRSFDYLSHHWPDYTGLEMAQLQAPDANLRLLHPDDRAAMAAAWDAARAAGSAFRCEGRWRRHDGAWRVFDNHALPQRDGDGAIGGWVGSSTDVTEQREAHAALLAAKEQALAAVRSKTDFLANMSHEIRSPMNAVLGMLQLLQRLPMPDVQRDYAAKADTAARSLLGILNDILDFSKVEEGKLTLDPHPFRFDQMLHELAIILSANASGKEIEVLFDIDPALPHWVEGDRLRLQQVLLNLAGNAIKFTSGGEVVLTICPGAVQGDRIEVLFRVSDTGIGIAPEHLDHIFDGFTQAEASTARRFGGTGLGLAISQKLVALMGGSLQVSSVQGQGSVFSFTLPLRRTVQHNERQLGHQMRFLQCLVVDDNGTGRQVLAAMLASFGWRVDAVASGEQALAAAAAKPYDVVFMDWRMPGLNGWDASLRLRAGAGVAGSAGGAGGPLIIMVTAHERELLAAAGGKLAPVVDAMLAKPLTASTLFDTVGALRLRDPGTGMGTGMGSAPMAASTPQGGKALAGLRILLVDDNPLNQQVARELLGAVGADVSVVDSGRGAVDAVCQAGARHDLVLMDIQMPDMDGYAATALIIAALGERRPPIVAMTANAMASDRAAALASGMVDHVGKPFDLEQLIAVILRHAAAPAAVPAMPALLPAAVGSTLDAPAALARMGGNQAVYQLALRSFDGEWQILAQQLTGAIEGELPELALAALHVIRGLGGMIGAVRLVQLASQAEQALQAGAPGPPRWDGARQVLDEGERAAEAALGASLPG
jgi:PAS domain S-box-containing protein